MFWLICVTMNIKNVPCLECKAWRRLRHWSMPWTITLCFTPTDTSIRFCLKSSTSYVFLVDSLSHILIWRYWGQGCSVDRNLEVHTSVLHYCTFWLGAVNDAQNVRADRPTARWKDNDQQNLSKMILWCRSVYRLTNCFRCLKIE